MKVHFTSPNDGTPHCYRGPGGPRGYLVPRNFPAREPLGSPILKIPFLIGWFYFIKFDEQKTAGIPLAGWSISESIKNMILFLGNDSDDTRRHCREQHTFKLSEKPHRHHRHHRHHVAGTRYRSIRHGTFLKVGYRRLYK